VFFTYLKPNLDTATTAQLTQKTHDMKKRYIANRLITVTSKPKTKIMQFLYACLFCSE